MYSPSDRSRLYTRYVVFIFFYIVKKPCLRILSFQYLVVATVMVTEHVTPMMVHVIVSQVGLLPLIVLFKHVCSYFKVNHKSLIFQIR